MRIIGKPESTRRTSFGGFEDVELAGAMCLCGCIGRGIQFDNRAVIVFERGKGFDEPSIGS